MAVDARDFKRWAETVDLPSSVAALARAMGVSRPTVQAQFVRGRVSDQTIVLAARAAGVSPVHALSSFAIYEGLADRMKPPTMTEVLSQTTYIDTAVEVVERLGGTMVGARDRYPEPPLPTLDGVRSWFYAIDHHDDLRRRVSEASGMGAQNLSASLTDNKLRPDLAVLAADLAGVSSTSGLVVTGFIHSTEGGWPHDARKQALAALTELELVDHLTQRSRHASRILTQATEERAKMQKFRDTLG